MVYRLRPHHIDSLVYNVARKKPSPRARARIIKATAKLYDDIESAIRVREFYESADEDTLVKVVLGNDYVCTTLRCPFRRQCAKKDYQAVAEVMASKLPPGTRRDLTLQMTPELSDKWSMRRYGLEVGKTYRLGDLFVVNDSDRIDDL